MNALVDADVIEALYRASQAGVVITLLVRGICGLCPGVPGVSETIEVRALVDRFLEHGRVFHFSNGGKDEVYIASADWMPRNFHRRVEVLIPIEDPAVKARLLDILALTLSDNVKSWLLKADGSYSRVVPKVGAPLVRSQQRFIDMARDKVKEADVGGRSSSRFYLAAVARQEQRSKEKTAAGKGRRRGERETLNKKGS
jgi:polyphosphate kinase